MLVLRRFGLPLLVSVVIGANVWIAASAFLPVARSTDVDYWFLPVNPILAIAAAAVVFAALLGLHAVSVRYLFPDGERGLLPRGPSDVSYFAPLLLLAVNLLALGNLVPALHGKWFVWSHLTVDLRRWL